MARQKRSSRILDQAARRLSGLKAVDEKIVLDGGYSAAAYSKAIDALRNTLDNYNTALSTVDALYVDIAKAEQTVANYSEQVLTGVAARFGKDSQQYKATGDIRKSDRKRPSRKATPEARTAEASAAC